MLSGKLQKACNQYVGGSHKAQKGGTSMDLAMDLQTETYNSLQVFVMCTCGVCLAMCIQIQDRHGKVVTSIGTTEFLRRRRRHYCNDNHQNLSPLPRRRYMFNYHPNNLNCGSCS